MALALVWLERFNTARFVSVLSQFGAAPLFFYLLHLYVLLIIYSLVFAWFGTNQGSYFGVDSIYSIWLIGVVLTLLLYWPTSVFATYKRRSNYSWTKYL
jgi:beta-lactamase regulating signal transducer with metallopeptidase domain